MNYLLGQRTKAWPNRVLLFIGRCGLGGLVAAQLPGSTAVVFTDHDPGANVRGKQVGSGGSLVVLESRTYSFIIMIV